MADDDKRFPARGKWDFSDDDKRLEAHRLRETNSDYQSGWGDGFKSGRKRGHQSWAAPVSVAIVLITTLASFTTLAIMRPDLIKWPEPAPVGVVCYFSGTLQMCR